MFSLQVLVEDFSVPPFTAGEVPDSTSRDTLATQTQRTIFHRPVVAADWPPLVIAVVLANLHARLVYVVVVGFLATQDAEEGTGIGICDGVAGREADHSAPVAQRLHSEDAVADIDGHFRVFLGVREPVAHVLFQIGWETLGGRVSDFPDLLRDEVGVLFLVKGYEISLLLSPLGELGNPVDLGAKNGAALGACCEGVHHPLAD
ncbi:MAG: hypothetical protein CMB99_00240 [Flavobacteriaceae bacterium]|nr:hypothetical protein [Flavobacteriaceae bacterium]